MVLFTVFKQFDTRGGAGSSYLGYSDFLEEVRGKRIKTATIAASQDQTDPHGSYVARIWGRRLTPAPNPKKPPVVSWVDVNLSQAMFIGVPEGR